MESTEAVENRTSPAKPVEPESAPAAAQKKTPFKESNPRDLMSPTDNLFSPCSSMLAKPKTRKTNSSSMPKKLLTQRMKAVQEQAAQEKKTSTENADATEDKS